MLPRRVARRVDRAAKAAGAAPSEDDRDVLLHEVRKPAKNERYAAELVVPVRGEPAARLAKQMEDLQEILGENQDSVVAHQKLREIGIAAYQAGENAFTFGLMHGLERARGGGCQAGLPRRAARGIEEERPRLATGS